MNIRLLSIFIIIILFPVLAALPAFGQQPVHRHPHPVMTQIDYAYARGQITLDQKVLYKFYAGYASDRLPPRFLPEEDMVVKCGTPAVIDFNKYRDRLSGATTSEIEQLLESSSLQAARSYTSPSGKFVLHYETSGEHAVPPGDADGNGTPDYVEWTAAAADSSWRHQVANLGFTDPVIPGDPYDLYFKKFNPYGVTVPAGNTTYIEIHNTFENFPSNTDPEGDVKGAIKVTVAHELKHAVQYVMNSWSGESDRWAEMDATLMEEVVYDNVNDYYNYLANSSSIFENPQDTFYPGSYYHVSWALYFEQKHGPAFWPGVWDRIEQDPNTRFIEAMTAELGGPDSYRREYIESQLWHYASGPANAVQNFGFEERDEYPDPIKNRYLAGKDSTVSPVTVPALAANYIELTPLASEEGFVRISVTKDSDFTGLGLIAYFKDGSSRQKVINGSGLSFIEEETPWRWDEIERIGIVVANGSESTPDSYRIKVTSVIPENITLRQNYPNPFNPTTIIPFTLTEATHVSLNVYDVAGRLVSTLIDEELPAGYYNNVRFDAGGLASGIYFYRLMTDQKVITKKMSLIK